MPLGREADLGLVHFVLDGPPVAPSPKGGQTPKIFGPVSCGKTAGWIKMPLDMEVGLVPGHNVLDGNPAPQKRGAGHPQFWPMSIVAKRLDGSR